MDKARVVITPEQWDALSSLHTATAQRRPTGWVRWFAACPCGWSLDQVGGREGAQRAAEEHNTELNPDEPAEPECNCLVLLGADLVETSPLDCPLHKEPRSND